MSGFSVNMRTLLVFLDLTDNIMYILNGVMMAVTFFIFRAVLFAWVLFFKIGWQPCVGLVTGSYWDKYPDQKNAIYSKLSVVSLIVMFFINYFWFYKICTGLMKAVSKFGKGSKTKS